MSTAELSTTEEGSTEEGPKPAASVKLISVIRLPAHHSAAIPVKVEELGGSVLIETGLQLDDGLHIEDSVVEVDKDGQTTVLIFNQGNSPCHLDSGIEIAQASELDFEPSRVAKDSVLEQPDQSDSGRQEDNGITDKVQMEVWAVNVLLNGTVCSNEYIK